MQPMNGEDKRLESLLALARARATGSGVIAGGSKTFVFQPGGTASPNVFTSWAALYSALNASTPISANGFRAPTTIQIDDSFVSPAVIPAGAYNLDSVTFTSISGFATGGATLSLAAGVTITAGTLTFSDWLLLVSSVQGAPVISVSGAAQRLNLFVNNGAQLTMPAGSSPLIAVTNGSLVAVLNAFGRLGDGVHNVITTVAPGSTEVVAAGISTVAVASIGGAGAAAALYVNDSSSPINIAGATVLLFSRATLVAYVPGVAGNWFPAPATVAAALDQLAARTNRIQQINNTTTNGQGVGGPTIVAVTQGVVTGSGLFRWSFACNIPTAAAGDVSTIQIVFQCGTGVVAYTGQASVAANNGSIVPAGSSVVVASGVAGTGIAITGGLTGPTTCTPGAQAQKTLGTLAAGDAFSASGFLRAASGAGLPLGANVFAELEYTNVGGNRVVQNIVLTLEET